MCMFVFTWFIKAITNMEKSFKEKQWGLGMVKKGLKQVGDIQCSALLYPLSLIHI